MSFFATSANAIFGLPLPFFFFSFFKIRRKILLKKKKNYFIQKITKQPKSIKEITKTINKKEVSL